MYYEVIIISNIISIRLPEDLRKELNEISKNESRPISDLIRDSLKKYIAIYRFRKLRDIILPFAESQGILTDEDVFKFIS